jgi:uncharacterized lipoprotein YddW (UPF0748 family)
MGLALLAVAGCAASYVPSDVTPPPVAREFRAAWVATVGNSVWPSKPGLSTAEQKSELLALLNRAQQLKMNAIIFQVRPACDALYPSKLEPWSEYLTGTMGQPPSPFYDPLEFAIAEAHRRGLELHAWFNPYRAHHFNAKSPIAPTHISKTRPQLVCRYGSYLWLDPGERDVQDYSLSVVMDVLKRYDVDGIHFDDYFYPYAVTGADGKDLNFPDDNSWQKFGVKSGLSRDDWRRENVNDFVERTYKTIKATKPWVKFGISPFGIWRPGHPPQIRGMDAYARLYADARKWLLNGWADYFAPQLYWAVEPRDQSFPVLLDWWNDQNPKRRHIWPGLDTTKLQGAGTGPAWDASEILSQIRLSTAQPVSAGHVHWNLKAVSLSATLQAGLQRGPYAAPALVPACPWLSTNRLERLVFSMSRTKPGETRLTFDAAPGNLPCWWLLQTKRGSDWVAEILPGSTRLSREFTGTQPDAVAVTPIDRAGVAGRPLVLQKN